MAARIVLYEPAAGGHQLYHARLIAEAIQAAGLPLTFATTAEALAHPSSQPLRETLEAGGSEILLTTPKPGAYALARKLHPVLQQQFTYTDSLRKALRSKGGKAAFRHVFIPFFDAYMICPLALRMNPTAGVPMSGILHRTRFHMPAMGIKTTTPFHVRVERQVYASMRRRSDVSLLFTMDPYLERFYQSPRIKFLPDPGVYAPVRARDAIRAELGIAPGQLCILAYGALDSRKAIGTLIAGVLGLPEPERVCVVVAGRQDEHVRDIMASGPAETLRGRGLLHTVPGFLDDRLVDDLFLASDVCWICYSNSDGNSGVLMKAGHAERPVITAPTGISARIVTDDRIGWQADPDDPSVVTATLQAILADPAGRAAAGERIKARFKDHTLENFTGPIVQHLLGAEPARS